MKITLNEQIKNIKNLVNKLTPQYSEDEALTGEEEDQEPLQLNNVDSFLSKILDIANTGGLSYGVNSYRDGVKLVQIGLLLLGYSLPKHGIDGLFGPETLNAVKKFKRDYNIMDQSNNMPPQMLTELVKQLNSKGLSIDDLSNKIERINTGGNTYFTDLDLNDKNDYLMYTKICQSFIDIHHPNPLNISGEMLAYGAKLAYNRYQKYIPPEFALSQLLLEGGIGDNNPDSRPIRTKNPFNIGNVDKGQNIKYSNIQFAINAYYDLIARKYIGNGKTAADLIQNFQNKFGQRYASNQNYEVNLANIVRDVNKVAQNILTV
jgi:peptidoglycan hydrolase-like protein with peptidoglycan-binding domain